MHKALFIDRDGVINREKNYVYRIEDFEFMDGIFEVLRAFQSNNFRIIVVTNQAGIARGIYSEDDFESITKWMLDEFANRGIEISDVFYDPYHPVHGIGKYKKDSYDRKPRPGMLLKASEKHDIDMKSSYLIGDKLSDIEAGSRAGLRHLFLLKSEKYPEVKKSDSDYVLIDQLKDVLNFIDKNTDL